MLTLQVLDSDVQLNNFKTIGHKSFYSGEDVTVVLRIIDFTKQLRYIPASSATFSIDLLKSDKTTINKIPVFTFDPDDRSIIQFTITAAESNDIISQDLKLFISESGLTKVANLKQGISKITSGGC